MGDTRSLAAALAANYNRRVLAMRKEYGMAWTRRQTLTFIDRLLAASRVEGIDDVDLRVLVRIYNREIQS
jgi:hypothetical protein